MKSDTIHAAPKGSCFFVKIVARVPQIQIITIKNTHGLFNTGNIYCIFYTGLVTTKGIAVNRVCCSVS